MSIKDIKEIYKIFEDTDIGEVEIHNGDQKLRFCIGGKQSAAPAVSQTAPLSAPVSQDDKPKVQDNKVIDVVSKWVGFFTRLNPKTGDYFLKLRDEVKKGDIIALVRVLGVLQEVKAEVDGKLKEILVEEGQPIEYGQPIMRIEKS
jgi:biotin carboxyl carrier protein